MKNVVQITCHMRANKKDKFLHHLHNTNFIGNTFFKT